MALIEKLTAIADAIREKTDGTELLTLDAMAEAIAGIESGTGGLAFNPFNLEKYVVGTVTPSETITTSYTVVIPYSKLGVDNAGHTWDDKYSICFVFIQSIPYETQRMLRYAVKIPECMGSNGDVRDSGYGGGGGGVYHDSDRSILTYEFDDASKEIKFAISLNQYSCLPAGVTYKWIAGFVGGW